MAAKSIKNGEEKLTLQHLFDYAAPGENYIVEIAKESEDYKLQVNKGGLNLQEERRHGPLKKHIYGVLEERGLTPLEVATFEMKEIVEEYIKAQTDKFMYQVFFFGDGVLMTSELKEYEKEETGLLVVSEEASTSLSNNINSLGKYIQKLGVSSIEEVVENKDERGFRAWSLWLQMQNLALNLQERNERRAKEAKDSLRDYASSFYENVNIKNEPILTKKQINQIEAAIKNKPSLLLMHYLLLYTGEQMTRMYDLPLRQIIN